MLYNPLLFIQYFIKNCFLIFFYSRRRGSVGSHILRNNNLAQEIQNGSGLSGSGNIVSVWLSWRAEAGRGQEFPQLLRA